MLVIGVDEAGYGPLLGPLLVAGSAFRVPEPEAGQLPDADAVGVRIRRAFAGRSRGPARLLVDDSKKVYRNRGLEGLEGPLLAMLAATDCAWPDVLDDFLVGVGVDPGDRRARRWYAGAPPRFPLRTEEPELLDEVAAFRKRLVAEGVECVGLAADVVPEDRLNALFDVSGNKADTLFDLSASILEGLASAARPGETVLAVMDRQGGRRYYLGPLQRRFPDGFPWTLAESATSSRYRIDRGGRSWFVEFRVGGDAEAPQVGLASMLAKYLREVYMLLWNDWFATICPDVRATAGYTQDGRRWLAESRAAREAAGITDAEICRTR